MFVLYFKILGAVVPEKSLTKTILEQRKNGQIKGTINVRMLSYMIQVVVPNVCTKFQNPRRSSSWEIFDMEWVIEKRKKEGKITQLTSTLRRCIQNLKLRNMWWIILLEKKRKRTNKGNDKHKDAESLLHDTTTHIQCLNKISKS